MVKLTVLTTIRGLDEVIARYCYGCRNDNAKASGEGLQQPESRKCRRAAGRLGQDLRKMHCPVMPPYGLLGPPSGPTTDRRIYWSCARSRCDRRVAYGSW